MWAATLNANKNTKTPEVAKRRDSVPVFSFVDINFFFFGVVLYGLLAAFFLYTTEKLAPSSSELAEEVALYSDESKVEFEVYAVKACEPANGRASFRRPYIEADADHHIGPCAVFV